MLQDFIVNSSKMNKSANNNEPPNQEPKENIIIKDQQCSTTMLDYPLSTLMFCQVLLEFGALQLVTYKDIRLSKQEIHLSTYPIKPPVILTSFLPFRHTSLPGGNLKFLAKASVAKTLTWRPKMMLRKWCWKRCFFFPFGGHLGYILENRRCPLQKRPISKGK